MGVVNYHCPTCGATFMAMQIEQARADRKLDQPKPADTAGEVAV
jgi:hypothetical protein